MINNVNRVGRFTSSEIWKLTKKDRTGKGFGSPALTYIQEKKYERKLGRSLSTEVDARPLTWGKLNEAKAFELLGIEYQLVSDKTITHKDYPDYWSGSPDAVKDGVVIDLKCPYTLKSFCQLYEANTKELLINETQNGEAYYWQLVSNAILTGVDKAELIIYCPYEEELETIKQEADLYGYKWIANANNEQLPYLICNSILNDYNNIKVIDLDIPQEDKDFLNECVVKAIDLL